LAFLLLIAKADSVVQTAPCSLAFTPNFPISKPQRAALISCHNLQYSPVGRCRLVRVPGL
jgi:hypothetical protein